jgi:acyl-CoA dehydrogenase
MTEADVEVDRLLAESAEALFTRHSSPDTLRVAAAGEWPHELWSVVESAEFPLLGVPVEHGGSGGTIPQWAAVIRIAARHGAPIPLLETSLAGGLFGRVGLPIPEGPLTLAFCVPGGRGTAIANDVPYARRASTIAVLRAFDGPESVAILQPEDCTIRRGVNVAGEPRDDLEFRLDALTWHSPVALALRKELKLRYALGRALQLAGAAEAALEIVSDHVRDRVQFGVPLIELPVIKDRLAVLVEEATAARAAVEIATEAASGPNRELIIGAAKVRAGEAAGHVARLAHQLCGAIAMTQEHTLQHFTRRLWAWRDEQGNEAEWAVAIGRAIAQAGDVWPLLADDARPLSRAKA